MASPALLALLALPPEESLASVPAFLGRWIEPPEARARVELGLRAAVQGTSIEAWRDLLALLAGLGADYGLQPGHPLAGVLTSAFLEPLVAPGSRLEGLDHLREAEGVLGNGRLLIVANHLSYVDTVVLRQLLASQGSPLAERLCAVAGPKVYEEPLRLLAAAAHRSIRVPQSSRLRGNEVEIPPRELVRITRLCLADAERALDAGTAVVLFPEGTRSRSGRLQPFFKAVARWVALPGLTILPLGLGGTEAIYGLRDGGLAPAVVRGRFGPLLDADALQADGLDRLGVLRALHAAVAALLDRAPAGEALR